MRKLTERDSNNKVFDYCNRHIRLCHQNINGSKYADVIRPEVRGFGLKLNEHAALVGVYKGADDKVHLNNLKLNNVLRKVISRSKEFDRENLGQKTTDFLFPDGILTPVLRLSVQKKSDVVDDILRKLQSLDESHELFALHTELKIVYDALIASIEEETKAFNDIKDCETELLQLKIKLVKQYNDNFHTAAIDYDKSYANMLYPVIKSGSKKKKIAETVFGEKK